MTMEPVTELDARYGEEGAGPTPWERALARVAEAELSWLTTLRADGRPHTTPLITVVHEGAVHFTTGPAEQKARNLAGDPRCSLTTGADRWAEGLDVVVQGTAIRVTDDDELGALARAYLAKYGDVWAFEVEGGAFVAEGHRSLVFRIDPVTAHAFGKAPHSQTRYRFV